MQLKTEREPSYIAGCNAKRIQNSYLKKTMRAHTITGVFHVLF